MWLGTAEVRAPSWKNAVPLWDSDGLLQRDALWREADQVLTTRAMTRCALAGGWITLAALTIPGYAWVNGIPMLLGSGLALLHPRHALVVGIEERLPRIPGRLLEPLFVYPDQPYTNWVGIAEIAGLVWLAMAAGWPGRVPTIPRRPLSARGSSC